MPNPSSSTLVLARCDRAFAPDGGAPSWVHLFPEGRMTGRDGRIFDLADPGALVLAFQSSGVDLAVDDEHQNDVPEAKLHGPVPAAGWIKELKADAGGLWGRVEWTATAAEMPVLESGRPQGIPLPVAVFPVPPQDAPDRPPEGGRSGPQPEPAPWGRLPVRKPTGRPMPPTQQS